MHLVIPTFKRVDRQWTLQEITSRNVHKTFPVSLFCHPDEEEALQKYVQPGVDVRVQRPDVVNIAQLRQQMLEDADERYVLMLDDDLLFYVRKDPAKTNLRYIVRGPEGEAEFGAMLRTIEDWMKAGFAHASISAREGNNRIETPHKHNTRPLRALGYDRDVVLGKGFSFTAHGMCDKEDFCMALQLLTAGLASRHSYFFAQGQKTGSQTHGGCEVYRTREKMAESSHKLAELWPDFVTAVEKKTKAAWGGGTRIDVRIQWAKAFKSSGAELPAGAEPV